MYCQRIDRSMSKIQTRSLAVAVRRAPPNILAGHRSLASLPGDARHWARFAQLTRVYVDKTTFPLSFELGPSWCPTYRSGGFGRSQRGNGTAIVPKHGTGKSRDGTPARNGRSQRAPDLHQHASLPHILTPNRPWDSVFFHPRISRNCQIFVEIVPHHPLTKTPLRPHIHEDIGSVSKTLLFATRHASFALV